MIVRPETPRAQTMQDGECITVIELHTIAFGHISFKNYAVLIEFLPE